MPVSGDHLSASLQRFVDRHLPSMDHVEVALRVGASPDLDHTAENVAAEARMQEPRARDALEQLVESGLLVRTPLGFRLAGMPTDSDALRQLAVAYTVRPVTLVRAVYERPWTVVRDARGASDGEDGDTNQ
jgi:hypothetical protein